MLHKELDLFQSKIFAANEQMWKQIKAKLEAVGLETRQMFNQIMLKFDSLQKVGHEGFVSFETSDLRQKGLSDSAVATRGVT